MASTISRATSHRVLTGVLSSEQKRLRRLRNVMRGLGFSEAHTSSFHGRRDLDVLGLPADDRRSRVIEVKNPLREEESLLRSTLLPGLAQSVRFNTGHGASSVALFEIGKVFFNEESPELGVVPDQPDVLGFVAVGELGPVDLARLRAERRRLHGDVGLASIVAQMGLTSVEILQDEVPGLHPGRAGYVVLDGATVGYVGELHPSVARSFDFSGRVVVERSISDRWSPILVFGRFASQACTRRANSIFRSTPRRICGQNQSNGLLGRLGETSSNRSRCLMSSSAMVSRRSDFASVSELRIALWTADDATAVREAIVEAVGAETAPPCEERGRCQRTSWP